MSEIAPANQPCSQSIIIIKRILCAFLIFCMAPPLSAENIVDKTILPHQQNPLRKQRKIIPPSTFYIDFQNGSDQNPGTRQRPWKHHPWDDQATGIPVRVAGSHRYIFRNGVIYRGTLFADESGTEQTPILLGREPDWGKGRPLLQASMQVKQTWTRCSAKAFPQLQPAVAAKIWVTDWAQPFVPHTLFKMTSGRPKPLYLAREPDWLPWTEDKGDDVRKDWWEINECLLEMKLEVDSTAGFKVGDNVSGTGKWIDKEEDRVNLSQGSTQVVAVQGNTITILVRQLKKGEFGVKAFISNGHTMTTIRKMPSSHEMFTRVQDPLHLKAFSRFPAQSWDNGVIWSENNYGVSPLPAQILSFDPINSEIRSNFHKNTKGPKKYSRYFIENMPFLLDEPGEFFYDKKRKKLFVRLTDDADPNTTALDAGRYRYNLRLFNQSNIQVAGLDFSACNEVEVLDTFGSDYWRGGLTNSAILIRGQVKNITVRDCRFEYLPAGVVSASYHTDREDTLENISVENCTFRHMGITAVTLGGSSFLPWYVRSKGVVGRLKNARVNYNTVYNCGFRKMRIGNFDQALALHDVEIGEMAGNRTYRTGGAGVIAFAPNFYSLAHRQVPVQRISIHDNRVKDSLLSLQDFGGIAVWYGGPFYVYNNISENPVGFKQVHYKNWFSKKKDWFRTSCFGIGIYADQGYKVYAFNNIMIGKNNDCNDRIYNACGWNEAQGFLNTVFNNTIYRFAIPLRKGMLEANRSKYLNNLALEDGVEHIRYDTSDMEWDSLAYANNIFHGTVKRFGFIMQWRKNAIQQTIQKWRVAIGKYKPLANSTGKVIKSLPVRSPATGDFSPLPNTPVIDGAAKVFVPWGLYQVAGEWNFDRYNKNPAILLDEHLFWNRDWDDRFTARKTTPRYNLDAVGVNATSYTDGILESWGKGALKLDGQKQYCQLPDNQIMNVGTGNFLIETMLETTSNGPLVGKMDAQRGYQLSILPDGNLALSLRFAPKVEFVSRTNSIDIRDGTWHHIIAEVDRQKKPYIAIYVDGKVIACSTTGTLKDNSLNNTALFMLAKKGKKYLAVTLDYCRIARGTLRDAKTNIAELYQWQFNGPFLRDFFGRKPVHKIRDIGAIEFAPGKKTRLTDLK